METANISSRHVPLDNRIIISVSVVIMTKSEFVHIVETFIPNKILQIYRNRKPALRWMRRQAVYEKEIRRIRSHGAPIKVLFIAKFINEWKFDSVYKLMAQDPLFEPMILVCPMVRYTVFTPEQAEVAFHHTYDTFVQRGYNVMKACEKMTDEGIEVDEIAPDIVFFSSLWTQFLHEKYSHTYLEKYLKCYVDYGFCSIANEWGYSSPFHRLMWRYYAECEDIKQLALAAQPWEMRNTVVTGYPPIDEYISAKEDNSFWRNPDKKFKRIIWAPHHTITGHQQLLHFSTFIENAETMLKIAEKYKDSVQFAFKPHPILLHNLYGHPQWGKAKADEYYKRWATGENTSLVNDTYIDLFKSSDAMIHDCGSFIVEYLYTKNPVMYLGNTREEQSNIVGKKAYACHYHGMDRNDIEHFIEEVVLIGNDEMSAKREQFYNEVLLPPHGCTAAENIVNDIKQALKIK